MLGSAAAGRETGIVASLSGDIAGEKRTLRATPSLHELGVLWCACSSEGRLYSIDTAVAYVCRMDARSYDIQHSTQAL